MPEPRRIRAALLHYSCPPVVGGVEEIVRQHAEVLHRLGQSVQVWAGMGEVYTDEFPVRLDPRLGSRHPQVQEAHRRSLAGDHALTRRLTEEILALLRDWGRQVDVILAHNVLQMPFNLPLALALRRLAGEEGAPQVVSWAHDSPYFRRRVAPHLFQPPWSCLARGHRRIHYVTISHSRRELFERHLGDFGWNVVHNGIDPVSFFYLDPKTVRLAEELRLFDRELVVVQPARVTPRKNQELAIRIVHGLKQLGRDVLFILTGAYDPHFPEAVAYYRHLRGLIEELGLQDNVAILAEYTFADGTRLELDRVFMRDLYLVADLLLMTSTDEGFGLPLLEAGMIKLPIACTNLPIFHEVSDGVCFIEAHDPPLFSAGRIVEYLSRTGPHQMFRHTMSRFTWSRICERELIPFLQSII